MDQRRFTTFLLLILAAWMFSNVLFPPPQPPPEADAPADQVAQDEAAEPAEVDGVDLASEANAADDDALPPDVAAEDVSYPLVYATLGSLDPSSGYRLLATISSRGAAIDRIELASPRFRDLHDRSGYLGQLAPRPRIDGQDDSASLQPLPSPGVPVQAVGPGTPAAVAGIEVGDRIVGWGSEPVEPIENNVALRAKLLKTVPGQTITLQVDRDGQPTRQVEVTLARRPLDVMRPEIENMELRGADLPEGFVDPASFLTSLDAVGGVKLANEAKRAVDAQLLHENWEVIVQEENRVALRCVLPLQQLAIVKTYSIKEVPEDQREDRNFPGYDLKLDIEIQNLAGKRQAISYRQTGPTGLPIEGWWYANRISHGWSVAGLRDVVVRFEGKGAKQIRATSIAEGDESPMGQGKSLAYATVDAQYFAAGLIPQKESLEEVWFDSIEPLRVGPEPQKSDRKTLTNVSFSMIRESTSLDANGTLRDSYQIFAGPKRPELLKQYYVADQTHYNLSDLIYYGWFGKIAKAMLAVLHFFYGFVGNYGIAIVMLTIAVRTCMFPLSLKQTQSMARMQALKPELDKINDKYKSDMQKKQQAMQELYAKHKINPLSGCLPLFIQLPIFMGLYRGLMIDVELRQSPLLGPAIRWCSNLAAPDMLLDWTPIMPSMITSGEGLLGLGPYLNVLPLVTVGLFLASQQMFMPEPTNEQAALQQKMMKYMTLFMGLIFYKVASGLCLYFIVSSLWGIIERKLLPKSVPADTKPESPGRGAQATGTSERRPRNSSGSSPRNGSPPSKKRQKAKRKK